MADARNDNEEDEDRAKAKRMFARAIDEFIKTENDFVKNMQITSTALSGESAIDNNHLQAAYSERGDVSEMVAVLRQMISSLHEPDYFQVNNPDPDAFDRHLKAMTELALQCIAVNGRKDSFHSKLKASITNAIDESIAQFEASNQETQMTLDDFDRLSAAAGSKELLFLREKNSFLYPMQRMGKYPLLFKEILSNISDDVSEDVKARFKKMSASSVSYLTYLNQAKDLYLRLTELQAASPAASKAIEKLKSGIFNSIPNVDGLAKARLFVDLIVNLNNYLENKGRHRKEAAQIINIVLNNDSLEHVKGQIQVMGDIGSTGRLHALVEDFMTAAQKHIDAEYGLGASSDTASSDSDLDQEDDLSFDEDSDDDVVIEGPGGYSDHIKVQETSQELGEDLVKDEKEQELDDLMQIADEAEKYAKDHPSSTTDDELLADLEKKSDDEFLAELLQDLEEQEAIVKKEHASFATIMNGWFEKFDVAKLDKLCEDLGFPKAEFKELHSVLKSHGAEIRDYLKNNPMTMADFQKCLTNITEPKTAAFTYEMRQLEKNLSKIGISKAPAEQLELILDANLDRKQNNQKAQEAPKAEAPKAEAPKAEAPKAETPKAETPKAEAPKAEAPKAEVPKAEVPKAEVPKAEVPKAEVPKAKAQKQKGKIAQWFEKIKAKSHSQSKDPTKKISPPASAGQAIAKNDDPAGGLKSEKPDDKPTTLRRRR